MPSTAHRPPDLSVFCHLARDKDAVRWAEARRDGTLVGRNDPTPYGYGRAEGMGCRVAFSSSAPEGPLGKAARYAARLALGYDREHARRQLPAMSAVDAVWCHTESQTLAIADVLGDRRAGRPAIVGQVVWLLDRWPSLGRRAQARVRRLVRRLDVLTTLSPLNAEAARRLFPDVDVRFVPFGIPAEGPTAPRDRSGAAPVVVVAVGNDRHRDWRTLADAFDGVPGVDLRVLSGTAPTSIATVGVGAGADASRVTVAPARTHPDLLRCYDEAAVAVVPLAPNLHASGITAVQEALLAGVPVVATDVGGLDHYFGPDAVRYVPHGDPAALRDAILAVARSPLSATSVEAAQRRIREAGLDAEGYVRRHVEITREILGR